MKTLNIWKLIKEIIIGFAIVFWMCLKALTVSISSLCIIWVLAQLSLESKVFGFTATVIALFALIYMIKLLVEPVIEIIKKRKDEKHN